MIEYVNPFEYEQATKLKPAQVLEYFIEDFSYARFINSRRNIFLVEVNAGTGKNDDIPLLFTPHSTTKMEKGE